MKTRYKIVDAEGDEIYPSIITPGVELPVRVQSILFAQDKMGEDELVVTYRYLHDEPVVGTDMWQVALRVPDGKISNILQMLDVLYGVEVYRAWKVE